MAGRQLSDRNKGSATLGSARTGITQQRLVAASLAAVAFCCYHATLLPGLDLGDSSSFQTGVGWLTLTPRQAYPLYYAFGSVFVWLHPGEPARAMNLASAVYGAVAVGLATWLSCRLTQSAVAGAATGLFLGFSYTFWSQAITAEVYTLHLLLTGASMIALTSWADRPTSRRLAIFYAIFALGFGNHLSIILLLPAFAAFIVLHRRPGAADPLQPRMIAMAIGIALLGALQYVWNFRALWVSLEPPSSLIEGLGELWFDVTKADWRETMVMSLSEQGLRSRPDMYWFDVRQQFGVPGVLLAAIGFAYITLRWWRPGILLALTFLANFAFGWTYNVGDAYIFFLPSHYVLAIYAGGGVAAIVWVLAHVSTPTIAVTAGTLFLAYPVWRGYDTFPAVDRSSDDRAVWLLNQLTSPVDGRVEEETVYGLDSNWQIQNAFEYFMHERKPAVPWFTTLELDWGEHDTGVEGLNQLAVANSEIGRDLIVTPGVFSNLLIQPDSPVEHRELTLPSFGTRVRSAPAGTPYAFAVLLPDHEYPLDTNALGEAWNWLAPGVARPDLRAYTAMVGRVGGPPVLLESRDGPFRTKVTVESLVFDVRMESWLPTDTIRRAGFGHVILNRQHFLTLERGLSFAAVGPDRGAIYASGIFAPVPRLLVTPRP